VLTLHPGIRTFDGYTLDAAIEVPFTTRAAVDDTSDPADDAPAGCGCGSGTPVGLVPVALGALALRRRAR
jgi:MYXO-CTERM domain-containing protein